MAGRKVISKSAADRIIEDRIIAEQIIEVALAKGLVRTIRDGATVAQMGAPTGDSQEKMGLPRAVRTVVRIRDEARPAAPSSLSLKRIS